ncbi:Ulp1 protease family, C-terminal catalytic domain containing protein [Parasponia andersonii]|uniref:Ulp1 protease family, C-terminal catalytic domain containing protein n=1 Tax=Parasponia andersonii TaxID=3476 RepID=A0A2P5DXL0_PARAD|nr:Ulp1 protease family, C-terminal catalytic domain containing protein [Parasponia andersonii]
MRVLIHQLLLRKVKSQNPAELQFFIGDSNLRFGFGEFALITVLNFAKDLDIMKYKSMSSSMRLMETYLNNVTNVRSGELEAIFLNCEDKEDVWKLGLCYLVDGLLMAQESNTKIMMDMLSFVENEEDFFNYPWGRRSYERTFPSLNKDMMHQRKNYLQKIKNNKKAKEAKYTVYGFSIALQYWTYEAFPSLLLVTKALLNPREAEKEFYKHIYHDPYQSLTSTGVEEEGINGEEEENKKEAAEAKRATEEAGIFHATRNKVEEEPSTDVPQSHKFYLELKTDITEWKANQTELKVNQVILNDKLDRLLKIMEEIKAHRQPTGSESEATQSDVLPEGYQAGEDVVISTPTKEHTPEEQQTLGVKELQVAEVATVKFGRKKRHIDAAFRLIRECLWLFPKMYRKKVALADTIDLPAYMFTVYDSDQALYNDARVEQAMRPMMKVLPYFLLNVEGVTDRADLDLTTTTKPRDFDVRRLLPNIVPQTVKSGDCGVFVVKHLECLLADIPLSNVVDDVMQHSRQKLCVDLFY